MVLISFSTKEAEDLLGSLYAADAEYGTNATQSLLIRKIEDYLEQAEEDEMAITNANDHKITTRVFSIEGFEPEHLMTAVDAEVKKLMRDAIADQRVIMGHTVTLFEKLESVVITFHTVKP